MEISPDQLPWQSVYKLLIGSVVPRPIGWISTVNENGQPNLAPFSFFNVVCGDPPTVLFCPDIRGTDLGIKDTLKNVRQTGEFVVNIVTEPLAGAMVKTSAELPEDMDEFEFASLDKSPSHAVQPPRVSASPIHFECQLRQIIEISALPGGGSIVIGEVIHIHVDPAVLVGEDKINPAALKAIGRMGGPTYCRTGDLFDLQRPASQIKKS